MDPKQGVDVSLQPCQKTRRRPFLLTFCVIVLSCFLTAVYAQSRQIGGASLDESWEMWAKRQASYFTRTGPRIEAEPKYPDEKPDPNESWDVWAKRQTCLKTKMECCISPYVRAKSAVNDLRQTLSREFFGQHLAMETTLNSLASHLKEFPPPRRPLVLSFHGWVGSGKTYLAQHIAKALFRNGENSGFYKFFRSGYDFPSKSESDLPGYWTKIQNELLTIGRKCEYSLFIFDEVDNMLPRTLDGLTPFIDHPAIVGDVSFRRSIFIFLSNAGGTEINSIALNRWKTGKPRESLTLRDFENVLTQNSFNNDGGLHRSALIHKILLDYFIPFLPLQKEHVVQCILHEASMQNMSQESEQELIPLAEELDYWPEDTPVYSKTGCKKIERLVGMFRQRKQTRSRREEL